MRVEHAETHLQGAVDGRAVMQVLRGYPRRGHGEVGNLALLKLLDEGVERLGGGAEPLRIARQQGIHGLRLTRRERALLLFHATPSKSR